MANAKFLAKDFPYLNNVNVDTRALGLHVPLSPFAMQVSSVRLDMMAGHMSQAMVLKGSNFSYLFSGSEHNLGQYEYSETQREQPGMVVAVIPKYPPVMASSMRISNNPMLTVLYVGDNDKKLHVMDVRSYTLGSDGFGYKNVWVNTHLLRPGEYIPQETTLVTSPSHKDGCYCYGLEANVAYMTMEGTIEDAVIVSRSFADKAETQELHQHTITIDINEHPLDLYGDGVDIKFLPDIGDVVRQDGLLAAFRKEDTEGFLANTTPEALRVPQLMHDTCYFAPPGAEILDLDFAVARNAKAPAHLYRQVTKYTDAIKLYWKGIVEAYQRFKHQNPSAQLSQPVNRLVTTAINRLIAAGESVPGMARRPKVKLIGKNGRPIEFIQVTITYMTRRPCSLGFKMAGRDGHKGVICQIVDDADMPVDDYGIRADVVIAPDSVIARMNSGQLYEQAINRTSEFVRRRLLQHVATEPDVAWDLLVDWYCDVNPNYAALVTAEYSDATDRLAHLKAAIQGGIHIHVPPGLETINMALIRHIKTKWKVPISPVTFTQRDIDGTLIGTFRTKRNVCIGSKYVLVLSKIPEASAPGVGYVNQYRTPMKPPPFDRIRHPIRQTPIRYGEDEWRIAKMDVKDPAEIMRVMCLQANSQKGLDALIERLLTDQHPSQIERVDISNDALMRSNTILRLFTHMFATTGIAIASHGPYPTRNPL